MNRGGGLLAGRLALGIATGAVLAGLLLHAVGAFGRVESSTIDTRFAIRGDRPPDGRIVLVKIDADTFAALGRRWPFPRSLHARVVDRLRAAGARAIAYDVQFSEPTTVREDNALILSVRRAGNVVLAATEVDDGGTANVLGSGAAQRAAHAHIGFAGFPVEPGGIIREVPAGVDGVPSFAGVAARVYRGLSAGDVGHNGDEWIDFAGPPGTFPAIDFSDVLGNSFDRETVRGRVVVVGAFASSLQDTHPTAVAPHELMAGAEVQANAISTVLRDRPLASAGWPLALIAIAISGALVPLSAVRLRRAVVPLALLLGCGYLGATQVAFGAGLVLPVVGPIAALLLGAAAVLVATVTATAVEHRRTRGQLERFVPASLVDALLADADEEGQLAGKETTGTVLAADLRAFTTFSETAPPGVVVEVLNRYFALMGEAVEAHGGVLVSFAGDGLIAVFGAPVDLDDHADRALDAAREIAGWRLAALNERLRADGLGVRFALGVGIASGPLVTGTIGSRRRVEFTAIGDPVNVASRVEQLTKEWNVPVLVAGSTVANLQRARDDLDDLGETSVRGREGTLALWSLSVGA
jgi:adenylate cyclase